MPGGWAGSTRTQPGNWKTLKASVLGRHAYICHVCQHAGAEQVDHIVPMARGGTHDRTNLAPIHQAPCSTCGRRCHVEKTQAESAEGRRLNPVSGARRAPGKHPGLL